MTDSEIQEKIRQLVVARLRSTPPNLGLIIGSNPSKEYSPEDIIKEIESGSSVGKEYIDMDIEFLRDLQNGLINV